MVVSLAVGCSLGLKMQQCNYIQSTLTYVGGFAVLTSSKNERSPSLRRLIFGWPFADDEAPENECINIELRKD
jgi:hypothetical protein